MRVFASAIPRDEQVFRVVQVSRRDAVLGWLGHHCSQPLFSPRASASTCWENTWWHTDLAWVCGTDALNTVVEEMSNMTEVVTS